MRIREVKLIDFLSEPDKQFTVPRYQRAYSWEADQCDELWRDLMRAARDGLPHFVGTFIYVDEPNECGQARAIVDGQQRLATVTLILAALVRRMRESGERKFGDAQAFSIFKSFCEDEYDGPLQDLLEELYAFCLVWAENYRYHAVKKYKLADWARLGRKTRVSGRPRAELDHPESRDYYQQHFGVDPQW